MIRRFPRAMAALAIACLGLWPAVSVHADDATAKSKLPEFKTETFTLSNGLQVILHEDHSTPIAAVDIWYHVGSKNERRGRTGFAHLFEHMMFQGSQHNEDEYFGPIQEAGGTLNGSTNEDRTNYWEVVPSNYLERALMVEADRMGWLLPAMTKEKLSNQQEVVRNERRQSGENQPYGVFFLQLNELIYPPEHPYGHSVIGSHEDLEAASLEDVKDFFRTYYTPCNATLCIGGDIDPKQARAWAERYFGPIAPGKPVQQLDRWVPDWTADRRVTMEDRVQLPRVYCVWHSPASYDDGDAALSLLARILSDGKGSRLYNRLVYTEQIAQDVRASQNSSQLASTFIVSATAKPQQTPQAIEAALQEEIARLLDKGVTGDELQRAKSSFEREFIDGWARVGSFGGRVDRFNEYNHYVGRPDYMRQDFDRHMRLSVADVNAAARRWLAKGHLIAQVVPFGKPAESKDTADRTRIPGANGPDPVLALPKMQRETLSNGLTLLLMEQHEIPVVQFNMVFRAGSAADPVGLAGLAAFTADMLDEGTKTRSAVAISEAARELGADLTIASSWDGITASIGSLRKNMDGALALLSDVVRNPAFDPKEAQRVRTTRQTQYLQSKDNPNALANRIGARAVFPASHPYSFTEMGTDKTLAAIAPAAMRDFYAKDLVPANATLIAVGDLTMADLKKSAVEAMGAWTGGPAPSVNVPDAPALSGIKLVLVDKPGATQSIVILGQLGVARGNPDEYAIRVMNQSLGGQFMSRINLNLREDKGYTYGARSFFDMRRTPGPFIATAAVQTEVTALAVTEFMKELRDVHGARPLSDKELQDARASLTLGFARQFETASDLANRLTDLVLYNLPADHFETFVPKVQAVSLEQANHAGRDYVHPDKLAVVVVGDLSRIEKDLLALQLGPVEYRDLDGNLMERPQLSSLGQ
jgi:zinc protease